MVGSPGLFIYLSIFGGGGGAGVGIIVSLLPGGYVLIHLCLFGCVSVAKISQNVFDQCACKFLESLGMTTNQAVELFVDVGKKLDEKFIKSYL